jgi:plastocyanin
MSESPSREVVLVARGMAFYVEGNPTPNPTIDLVAGERVRIILRNQDEGMVHDMAATRLPISFDLLNWREERELTLVVPDLPGSYAYVCRPHSVMMRGQIRVVRR